MAVPEQTPFIEYTANGTTTVFPLPFQCDKAEYLIVNLDGNEAPVGSWSFVNGSVTFNTAPANGVVVNIERNTPFQRTTDYQSYNNSFRPAPVNKDFDLIWWKLQELGYRDQVIWLALVKEIADRIAGDVNLQNQINTIDEWLADLQQNVNENTNDISQLVNDLSKEIADRITGDQILKDMFISMIDEAINEGTINALAITHLDSLEALEGVTNVWDGRTIYIKDLGNYRYDALTTSWVKAYQDAVNVKDGAENQKEINDKTTQFVPSIEVLLNLLVRKDGMQVNVGGIQGGRFTYVEDRKNENDGVITFHGWVRQWDGLNIKPEWAGAVGDGITDDTIAIQKCLDFCSPTQWDTSISVMNQKGSAKYELRLIGKYRITDTLWIGAYQSISGNVKLNFNSEIDGAIIFADFNDPLKPALSSSNWRTGGVRVPFDGITSGAEYDSGLISHTPSLKLTDFSIVTNKRQYMGLRVQNSPLSEIKVSCYGFDYGIVTNASWDSDFNCFTKHYKCGFLADIDGNNITVDGYYNAIEGTPISAKNLVSFFDSDTDLDSSFNDLNTQFGYVMRYSYGFSSKSIIAEHNDVGVVTANASAVYGSLYTEGNRKSGYVGFGNGDGVQIGLHTGAFDYAGLTLGAGGHVNINSIQKASNNPYFGSISIYNTTINMYAESNHYHAYANYINDKRTFYVDKTGSNSNVGMLDYYPLLSLDEAINRVKQSRRFKDRSKIVRNQEPAKIYILDNGEYTIDNEHILNCNLTIIGVGSSKPSIIFNKNLILTNSNVTFDNCSIIKNNVGGDYNTATVTRFGSNSVTLSNSDVNLISGGILACDYNGASDCSLMINGSNILGDSSKYLVSGNYENTSPHLVNVIRARGTISSQIIGRPDKGISVPVSWQNKILGL